MLKVEGGNWGNWGIGNPVSEKNHVYTSRIFNGKEGGDVNKQRYRLLFKMKRFTMSPKFFFCVSDSSLSSRRPFTLE